MPTTRKYIIQLKGSKPKASKSEVLKTWICGTRKIMNEYIKALKYNYKHGFLKTEYPNISKFKIVTSIQETPQTIVKSSISLSPV